MTDSKNRPEGIDTSALFRDECSKCGAWAEFAGRFVQRDDGLRYGVFYCPLCRENYLVWKKGLEEACQSPRP